MLHDRWLCSIRGKLWDIYYMYTTIFTIMSILFNINTNYHIKTEISIIEELFWKNYPYYIGGGGINLKFESFRNLGWNYTLLETVKSAWFCVLHKINSCMTTPSSGNSSFLQLLYFTIYNKWWDGAIAFDSIYIKSIWQEHVMGSYKVRSNIYF